MTHAQARLILAVETDPFLRYDAHQALSEPEPLPEPQRKHALDTVPREPDGSAWNDWCDERIKAALTQERRFLLDVTASALGEHVAKASKAMKRELADEMRLVRTELAEAKSTISELRSFLAADRSTPLDLPRLRPHVN